MHVINLAFTYNGQPRIINVESPKVITVFDGLELCITIQGYNYNLPVKDIIKVFQDDSNVIAQTIKYIHKEENQYCSKCKKDIPHIAKFCNDCGTSLDKKINYTWKDPNNEKH